MTSTAQTDQPGPFYSQPAQAALEQLKAELNRGLSAAEAQQRLARYGYNELPSGKKTPLWRLFLAQFNDFVVLLLIVASLVSIALGDLIEGLAIMAIVILNAAIGLIQEQRADAALDALKKMAAPDAQVLRDGAHARVPARELVPGDIVFLEAGNYVPADLRLIESYNLQVNESALTGESTPVAKRADAIIEAGAPIGDRVNIAYSSTVVTYGRGKGLVVNTGTHTEIGEIARMLGEIEEESTPLQKRLNQLGKTLSIVALILCAMVFGVELFRNTDFSLIGAQGLGAYLSTYSRNITDFFILAVSLAVAAVPEGLAAVVTINLALGMREMVKRNALIRRLTAVETLGSATAICTDKTGTLTQNVMNVVRMYASGHIYRITGDKYEPKGEFIEIGDKRLETGDSGENRQSQIPNPQLPFSNLLLGALLANDALLEESGEEENQPTYRVVGDPTEGALVVAAAKAGLWRAGAEQDYPRVAEVPFDADRKMMTTVHEVKHDSQAVLTSSAGALLVFTKGAPDIVLAHCTQHWLGDRAQPLTEQDREHLLDVNTAMASDALRVLAVALKPLAREELPPEAQLNGPALEHDLIFLGLLGMIDPPRPEVIPAIETARKAGIRTIMITGDYSVTARAIAQEIGLGITNGAPKVVAGSQIEEMSDAQLAEQVKTVSVFARVSPEHKVRIVTAVKSIGNVVAMTGDGVNDAPALKRADIGVSMGITGTDVSKETADMVLTDDNYASIVKAVEQGRIIYSNIRKFVFYLLGCNVAEIVIIFVATLLGLKSPLAAIQLLWMNLVTDGAPALALGLEKGDPDVMRIPPRPASEPIINRRMVLGMATQTVAIALMVLGAYMLALQVYPVQAETIGFLALCFAELPLAYTSRSERFSLLKIGPFSNRTMQYAILSSVVGLLVVTYVPFLNVVFDTVPLGLEHWLLILPPMIVPALVAELTKFVVRRMGWS
jgi:Ca2+-transporting ATPase